MKELGIDLAEVRTFFSKAHGTPFILVKVAPNRTQEWTRLLGVPARRCYISDSRLQDAVEKNNCHPELVVENVIPDKGSVMAGDYGEITTAMYLASVAHPIEVLEPKMWRLKSNRKKASEGSDVVQFQLPDWPKASSDDKIICAEVKTKSTNGVSTPIESAIEDSRKDRENRLTRTLIWLRERALFDNLGTVELAHLDRFIRATDHPPAVYEFRAVAVISSELIDDEVANVTVPDADLCTLIVISIPDLKNNYERLYQVLVTGAASGVAGP